VDSLLGVIQKLEALGEDTISSPITTQLRAGPHGATFKRIPVDAIVTLHANAGPGLQSHLLTAFVSCLPF
jgi:hypothetical protein